MKITVISASSLLSFQRKMRVNKQILIRAIPFTDSITNEECYKMMYVEAF